MKQLYTSKLLLITMATFAVIGGYFVWHQTTQAQVADPDVTVDDLAKQIEESKVKLEDLKKQAAIYQKNIRLKQEEQLSLKNQMEVLTNQVAKTQLDIQATEEETKKTELEVRSTEISIVEREDDIDRKKTELTDILKQIDAQENTNYLEIFILNSSISDFFNHVESTKLLSQNLQASLEKVKILKQQLVEKKTDLDKKRQELLDLKKDLAIQKSELQGQLAYKDELYAETKDSEQKFYDLFWQSKKEQEQADADISGLEKQKRAKLQQLEESQKRELTDTDFIWPVPQRGITAYFHDESYPFRNIFEHPAIDLRAGQGTSIKAAADGYVLKAKDNGKGYSYIALIHADGLSTVYGHVSKIFVKEDEFIAKGEVIGLSGGMPGTAGAGRLTTGPHLHFETRLNGIPVDPLLYLP